MVVVALAFVAATGSAVYLLPVIGCPLMMGAMMWMMAGMGGHGAIPMLRRLHRRHCGWAVPGGVLAAMAAVFVFSSFVIAPALTGSSDTSATPSTQNVPLAPAGVSPTEHEAHHH